MEITSSAFYILGAIVFWGILFLFVKAFRRMRLPQSGEAFAAIEIEWPDRFRGSIKIEGDTVIEFPIPEADIEALNAEAGYIPAGQALIRHRQFKKGYDHHALVLLDRAFLDVDTINVDVAFKPREGEAAMLPVEGEIELFVAYIDGNVLVKTFEVAEKEFFMRGSGHKSLAFKHVRKRLQSYVR